MVPILASIDLILRGGACILLLLVCMLLLRDYGRTVAGRLGAMFALGAAAHALWTSIALPRQFGVVDVVLMALSTGNSLVFWLFARALFNDGYRPRWWHAALWCALAAAGIACGLGNLHGLRPVLSMQVVLFAALAGAQTLATWSADLVEPRRRLRLFIVATAAGYTMVTAVAGVLGSDLPSANFVAVEGAVLLCLAAVVAFSLLRVSGDDLMFSADPARGKMAGAEAAKSLDAVDADQVAALTRAMSEQRWYRQEGLTIGGLAKLQGLPEYKLRRLINQGLGFRNFTHFLNHYRLQDAKSALADRLKSTTPILTIALDSGFSSLGPFNRAFKADNGITPGEYRRTRSAAASAADGRRSIQ